MRNMKTVPYDEMFTLSAPSPKWVWNAQGQLVEIPAGQPAFGYDRFTGEPLGQIVESVGATNVLLNSFAPATQTVSVSDATTYTLSVYGSGSAEITAGGSGTATDGSPLTFTTAGTSVTVTVTGTLEVFQLEAGSAATSPIETTGSAVTRAADIATIQNVDTAEWWGASEGWARVQFDGMRQVGGNTTLLLLSGGGTRFVMYTDSSAALLSYDGTNILNSGVPCVDVPTAGIVTWSTPQGTFKILADGGSVVSSSYNGSFSGISNFNIAVDDMTVELGHLSFGKNYLSDSEMLDKIQELTS